MKLREKLKKTDSCKTVLYVREHILQYCRVSRFTSNLHRLRIGTWGVDASEKRPISWKVFYNFKPSVPIFSS